MPARRSANAGGLSFSFLHLIANSLKLSGDPYFYNRDGDYIIGKEGCSKILILGFIKTDSPELIRKGILHLQSELSKDEYLASIPSIKKSLIAFHGTDDCAEVREKVFKLIKELPF